MGLARATRRIALGEEIQTIFATPFDAPSLGVRLTCACGFALFPSSAAEPDELVRLADAALYRAKAGGPGGAAVFDARASRTAASGAAFEDAFRRAAAEPEGVVPFRPIVDFATGTAALNCLRA